MLRRLVPMVAVLLLGCDEEDPALSERCIMVRMRAIELAHAYDQLVRLGDPASASARVALAKLQNENWQCFR